MKAFITGVTGQDGALMAKNLLRIGYEVVGGYRRGNAKLWRLEELGISRELKLIDYEIGNGENLSYLLREEEFDEIYHFAGISRTSDSFHHPTSILNTNVNGVLELLEAARLWKLHGKIFIAGSSEIFTATPDGIPRNELSGIGPKNPYGVSHASTKYLSDIYRDVYGLPIYYGILFNHESYLRDSIFVTKKLTTEFAELRSGSRSHIEIGNFESYRDWGLAEDYVVAINDLLRKGEQGNYVFATGVLNSLKDLIFHVAQLYGFTIEFSLREGLWSGKDTRTGKVLIYSNPKYFRPVDTPGLVGDPSKLYKVIDMRFSGDIEVIARSINRNLEK